MATTQSSGGVPYVDQQGNQRQAFGKKSSNASAAPAGEKKGFFSMFSGSKKSNKASKKPLPPVQKAAPAPAPPVIPTIPNEHLAKEQAPVAQPPVQEQAPPVPPVLHTVQEPARMEQQQPQAPIHPDMLPQAQATDPPPPAAMDFHSAAAVEAEMAANMRLVKTEMLDGSVQDLPYCVAQQLKDLGLCKIVDGFTHPALPQQLQQPAVPEVEIQTLPGYYPQRAPPKGVPMSTSAPNNAAPRQQQQYIPQGTMSIPQQSMAMPLHQHRSLMPPPPVQDEMVELEMPDGRICLIPQSEAQKMGAIPAADHHVQHNHMPPQTQQTVNHMTPMQGGRPMSSGMQMGGVIEIGPPQILSGPPIPMGTMQQAIHHNGMPVQMQQQVGMQMLQQQPQQQRMQTVVINKQQQEPIVQLIMPNGEVKMLPKSQALQIANQIKSQQAQQRPQSLSMPQPVQHVQAMAPRSMSMIINQEHNFQGFQQQQQGFQQQQPAFDPYQQQQGGFLHPYEDPSAGAGGMPHDMPNYQTQDFGGYPQGGQGFHQGFDQFGGGMDM